MQLVLVLVVILSLSSVGWLQTICGKYAQAKYGADNVTTEIALIQTLINYTVGYLTEELSTRNWFNGINNGVNFTDPSQSVALNNLYNHLYLFFGAALGCTQWNPTPATTDMQAIHNFDGVGQRLINKTAFEGFNQYVTSVSYGSIGMSTTDAIAVGKVLDGFRTGNGVPTNQICQDPDCTTSPYTVTLMDAPYNVFLPSFYSVPYGGNLYYYYSGTEYHSATLSNIPLNSTTPCPTSTPGFNYTFVYQGSFTTPGFTTAGNNWVACTYHCASNDMFMLVSVGEAPPTSAPTSTAINLFPVFLMCLLTVMAVLI